MNSGNRGSAAPIRGTGRVTFVEVGRGFYGIHSDDGARYDPGRLDKAYQRHGLRVRFVLRPRPGAMSVRMWGEPVELVSLEPVGAG